MATDRSILCLYLPVGFDQTMPAEEGKESAAITVVKMKMKAFQIILVALALISCARSESRTHVPEVTGTFSSSLKGSFVLLQLTSDHSFRLTFHAYGNSAPPSSEGKWKIVEGRIELMPVPASIDGPLKIVGDGISLVLQAKQVKFTRMSLKTEPNQSPQTTTGSSAPGHV